MKTPTQQYARKVGLAFASLALVFVVVELTLTFFLLQSDNMGPITLASRRWYAKYWRPINSLGYRDIEHTTLDPTGKKVAFIVGDSFTAGAGIKDPADRFSDIVRAGSGGAWLVLNVAKGGWNTVDELPAIANHPLRPHLVFVVYTINDIVPAADKNDISSAPYIREPHPWVRPLIENSSLLNFAYWRVYRVRHAYTAEQYNSDLHAYYHDPRIWGTQRADLQRIVDYTRGQGIELVFVIFPVLTNVEGSRSSTAVVAEFLRDQGVRVLDLTDALAGRSPSTLIVNNLDEHPNKKVHGEVADLMLAELLGAR